METFDKQTERHVKAISQMQTANNKAVTKHFFKNEAQTLDTFQALQLKSIDLT